MWSDVRISQAQSDEHFADLLAAIGGGSPQRAERWVARRDARRESRRRARLYVGWRRLVHA